MLAAHLRLVVVQCDANPVNVVACIFFVLFFPPAMVRCHSAHTGQADGGKGMCQAGTREDKEAEVKVLCKGATVVLNQGIQTQ